MKINVYKNKGYLVKSVFNTVSNRYDLMNNLMSLGIHKLWKKDFINFLSPQKNTTLVDVASGTGDIAELYLKKIAFKGKVFCVDNNKNMIANGKKNLKKYKNVKWFKSDAEKLPFRDNSFDYYTIGFGIRNVSNIEIALKEANRVLKPGGHFLCLEFSKIENKNLKKLYNLYSKILPGIGKVVVGDSLPYEYLVKSIKNFYSQKDLLKKMDKCNFYKTSYWNLSSGIVAIHSGWKV